jgi:hypothetical protein
MTSKQPETFNLHVPDAALADLRERLSRTRFPDQAPGEPWAFGTDLNWMAGFVDYWRDGFDWRAQEARLNSFPQYKVNLQGIDLHLCTCLGKALILIRCFCPTAGPVCGDRSEIGLILPI